MLLVRWNLHNHLCRLGRFLRAGLLCFFCKSSASSQFLRWQRSHQCSGTFSVVSLCFVNGVLFTSNSRACVPNNSDDTSGFLISNVILMRMIWSFVKNTALRLERVHLPFFSSQRVSLRSMLGVHHPPSFDTTTFCICVLAVEMRASVKRGKAGSTGISSFFRSEQWRQIIQPFWVENHGFSPLLTCSFFLNFPLLLCFLSGTVGH